MLTSLLRRVAGWISRSAIFATGREKWQKNQLKYNLALSRTEKLIVGLYIILADFERGLFPPKFLDQAKTFERERGQYEARTGVELAESARWSRRTPFWLGAGTVPYIENYLRLMAEMSRRGLGEGSRILELGCGSGWMSEFLAASGCHCVGTSLSPFEIEHTSYRSNVVKERGSPGSLKYRISAMEELVQSLRDEAPFDFVFIHAALHHAYSWQACLRAVYEVLKPGGWFMICNEPGILHTFVSYRIARLDGTHEIGMNRDKIRRELTHVGFGPVEILRYRYRWLLGPIWLAARKNA